jgi:hypothetical protein
MARAGMGGDAGPDDAYSQHKCGGEVSDSPEILETSEQLGENVGFFFFP